MIILKGVYRDMKLYVTKPKYIEAAEIDTRWMELLLIRGIKSNIGDFLIRDKNGQEVVWPRKGFLSTYTELEEL